MSNPILHPEKKSHRNGDYTGDEVMLANRNSGTLLETLHHEVTPAGAHYLLNHFDIPFVADASQWSLQIEGQVSQALSVNLNELINLAEEQQLAKTLRVTLECAGNGRALLAPRWPSQPWKYEAVGTSDWHGIPLHHLLDKAKLKTSCRELVFHGTDEGIDGGDIHNFARSLSVDAALHDEVMLVWQMNGQPLLPQHGFPLRLIVPGWYGMASVKWLNRIEAIDHAFTGHQQVNSYIYHKEDSDEGVPVTHIRVKSLMIPPGIPDWSTRKRLVTPGTVQLTGRAWSGNGAAISKVEWCCDDHWQEATLEPTNHKYGWTKWTANWQANSGKHTLSCRATDANGDTQPVDPPWDKAGFGNNAIQQLEVWVEPCPT